MRNPNPITRAWRLEKCRKELGSDNPRCFDCPESDIACLELDHPVTEALDPNFKRVACCNDHRKRERDRDLAKLTKNGLHKSEESEREGLRRYLLLLALDHDSIADVVLSPAASPELIAATLRETAASLRRKAESL